MKWDILSTFDYDGEQFFLEKSEKIKLISMKELKWENFQCSTGCLEYVTKYNQFYLFGALSEAEKFRVISLFSTECPLQQCKIAGTIDFPPVRGFPLFKVFIIEGFHCSLNEQTAVSLSQFFFFLKMILHFLDSKVIFFSEISLFYASRLTFIS